MSRLDRVRNRLGEQWSKTEGVRDRLGEEWSKTEGVRDKLGEKWSKTIEIIEDRVIQHFPYRHQQLERDDLDDSGDEETPSRMQAKTAPPQDLKFVVPEDAQPGSPICIQGPHGPILVPLPDDALPGKECVWRLGPSHHYTVDVPEGSEAGCMVEFKGMNGESLHSLVPEGLKAGDQFKVSPPVVMVQVPVGAKAGQELTYLSPSQQPLLTHVPEGFPPGHYLPALYEVPMPQSQDAVQGLQAAPEAEKDDNANAADRGKAGEAGAEEANETDQFVVE